MKVNILYSKNIEINITTSEIENIVKDQIYKKLGWDKNWFLDGIYIKEEVDYNSSQLYNKIKIIREVTDKDISKVNLINELKFYGIL